MPQILPEQAKDINPLLAGSPTYADALGYYYDKVGNYLAQQQAASAQQGLWNPSTGLPTQAGLLQAARAYGGALVMGSTAPQSRLMAYHGTSAGPFNAFDQSLTGTGATEGRFARKVSDHGLYLATNEDHAAQYGPNVLKFSVDPTELHAIDAKSALSEWAKDMGYDSAQKMVDGYYGGDIYDAINADHYFIDALNEARSAGKKGAHVSFGDLKDNGKPLGDVLVIDDPSILQGE